jgi:NADPH:quinone reductase-like Zn-dependent oxidoreductase
MKGATSYQAVLVKKADPLKPEIALVERQLRTLTAGKVLVAVEAAPINPSDMMAMWGTYVFGKATPYVAGTVGVGRVVESGGGWLGRTMRGKRVACAGAKVGDGTWAEYMVTDATSCVPVPETMPVEHAANLLSNPLTAAGILHTLRREGHRHILQTAGAADIGRLIAWMAPQFQLEVTSLVRRSEHREELSRIPGHRVFDETVPGMEADLQAHIETKHITALVDPIGGSSPRKWAHLLRDHGLVLLYGKLSGEDAIIDVGSITAKQLVVRGFSIYRFIAEMRILSRFFFARRVVAILGQIPPRPVQSFIRLDEVPSTLDSIDSAAYKGKILIRFARTNP